MVIQKPKGAEGEGVRPDPQLGNRVSSLHGPVPPPSGQAEAPRLPAAWARPPRQQPSGRTPTWAVLPGGARAGRARAALGLVGREPGRLRAEARGRAIDGAPARPGNATAGDSLGKTDGETEAR